MLLEAVTCKVVSLNLTHLVDMEESKKVCVLVPNHRTAIQMMFAVAWKYMFSVSASKNSVTDWCHAGINLAEFCNSTNYKVPQSCYDSSASCVISGWTPRLCGPDNFLVKLIITVVWFASISPKFISHANVVDIEQVQWHIVKHILQIWRQSTQFMLGCVRQNLYMLGVKDWIIRWKSPVIYEQLIN